jgi:trafficking protein particle complex subunit 10
VRVIHGHGVVYTNTNERFAYRCVQVVWALDNDNPTAWAELISKLKDGLLAAFDAAVTQREDEVRRSEGQRQMPGWNFCTYFILKVGSMVS